MGLDDLVRRAGGERVRERNEALVLVPGRDCEPWPREQVVKVCSRPGAKARSREKSANCNRLAGNWLRACAPPVPAPLPQLTRVLLHDDDPVPLRQRTRFGQLLGRS